MSEEAGLIGDPYTWYTASVVLFGYIVWRFARKPVLGLLDAEIAKVRHELDEAKRLRAEAAATLEDYRKKQREALADAQSIIEQAREDATLLRAEAEASLKETLTRHEQKAAERIRMAEVEAAAEVRALIIEQAAAKARNLLMTKVDGAADAVLVNEVIAGLPSLSATNRGTG